jgi:DNA adenine methylase
MADRRKNALGRHAAPKRRPPKIAALNGEKLIPFGWYGGKFSHLAWLLPLLPKCHHYSEPFAGSGAVLLNRAPSPIETYNDLDGEVVNFFRVLRDEKEKLVEAIGLTPFSREEFTLACKLGSKLPLTEQDGTRYSADGGCQSCTMR